MHLKTWFSKAFNLSLLHSNRWAWVDYLKGIAILLVVYRHVLIGMERSNITIPEALENANMMFFSFRMPLFFILSGLFIYNSLKKRGFRNLAFIKFESLIYPYLIWAGIQITLQIILSNYTNAERTAWDYLFLFYNPRAIDQFWYLPALFNVSILYLFLRDKLQLKEVYHLLVGVVLYALSSYFSQISMISDFMEFYIFFALGSFIAPVFFKPELQKVLSNPLTLLAITPVFVLSQMYYLNQDAQVSQSIFLVIALIGCISMFILSFNFQRWDVLRFLRIVGFHSLQIYVIHVLVSACARILLTNIFGIHQPVLLLFTGIAISVIIPIAFYNLLIKDNILSFLFHIPKKQNNLSRVSSNSAGQ